MRRVLLPIALVVTGILAGGSLLPAQGNRSPEDPSRSAVDATSAISPVSGRDAQADIERLKQLATSDASANVHADLGLAYLRQGRATADPAYLTLASDAFESALSVDETNYRALVGSAVLAGSRHRFDDMERLGREAVAINPSSGAAHGVLGDALFEQGRYGAAIEAYQEMLDRRPDLAAYSRISYLYETLGNNAAAARWMRLALDASVGSADIAYSSYHLFLVELRRGNEGVARRHLQRAIELSPDDHLTLAGQGHLAFVDGDIELARRLFRAAFETVPSLAYMGALAELSTIQGDTEEAKRYYDMAFEREQQFIANDALADAELAVFSTDAGRVPHALELAKTLHRARATGATEEALGWALFNSGQPARALELLQASIEHGGDSHTLFFAAQAALELDKQPLAQRYLARALDLDPYFSYRYAGIAEEQLAELRSATSSDSDQG
jgi:tetratricopeptide (TPR) repeat protein